MVKKQNHFNSSYFTDQFYRQNYTKMVAVLVNYFGLEELSIAEDIAQDTFLEALEKWEPKTTPIKPEAWLMDVAKKKAINKLRRDKTLTNKIKPNVKKELLDSLTYGQRQEKDSMLQMIFTCCHPALPNESQVTLALKTLCGFRITEIAKALLTNESTVEKRLYRAREMFRNKNINYSIPKPQELEDRLSNAITTLYLLFNQGYYSDTNKNLIRTDMCYEAIRLQKQIVQSHDSYLAKSSLALMLLLFSRIESRIHNDGSIILLPDQDREKWDKSLIAEGIELLHDCLNHSHPNKYLLQAGIAAEHCVSPSFEVTNWESIYKQYCLLEKVENSPIIKLNKAIARFYLGKKKEALNDLLKLNSDPILQNNTSFHTSLGVFYSDLKERKKAALSFKTALKLSSSTAETEVIKNKLKAI